MSIANVIEKVISSARSDIYGAQWAKRANLCRPYGGPYGDCLKSGFRGGAERDSKPFEGRLH